MLHSLVLALIAVVIFVVGHLVGRRTAPKPAEPEPWRFGLNEAEAVSRALGGLNADSARVVMIAAHVGGMQFTLVKEAAEEISRYTAAAEQSMVEAESLRARAEQRDRLAIAYASRAKEVETLAANFAS